MPDEAQVSYVEFWTAFGCFVVYQEVNHVTFNLSLRKEKKQKSYNKNEEIDKADYNCYYLAIPTSRSVAGLS